ncbi:dimethyladenosine transferase 1, mitochondrial-like isoform X1 [Homarus americanus]|uniref:rRNA adenine N(6)-methyltransferase n=1 Tax=Homarus americanus TaxID=6706 RepID=A0A8J5K0M2_HOMAM|nr:dimethyladenosine transferase 1, mitochondrial-like isoform X1 [Homarus americanus]XP_042223755.1 dimethyladenosine transferase 1, mitochondrial-like isoform X1 [Homarus americanus]KAG7167985.1 Dimethyladenosine transferase 1-like [Homarus americanus]
MAGKAGSTTAKQVAAACLRLPPLPSTSDLVKLYNLRAVKQLSQNFLMDHKLSSKIVRKSGRIRDCHVCEVGPGPGGITRSILEQGAARVTVVEKDPRFLPVLELLRDASHGKLHIELGDVLTYNMEKLFPPDLALPWEDRPPRIHLIGNLPFNVATPLIIRWLRDISLRRNAWVNGRVRMTLTFQEEVVERMVAPTGHAQRCRLSIMCQNWCQATHKFTIPGRAFVPKPDVDVAIAHFVPRVEPQIPLEFWLVEKVVRCVFSFRQKYCKRGAGLLFPEDQRDEQIKKMFAVADVNPALRPFQLTMSEFNRLCHAYAAILEQQPSLAKFNVRERIVIVDGADYDDDNGGVIENIM